MSAADFAFAAELFMLVFGFSCWLFSSPKPQQIQTNPTRSIRYFDLLDEEDHAPASMPASKEESIPLLPDPWTEEAAMIQCSISVSSTSHDAPLLPQLCLPPAKKDVVLEGVLHLVETHLTLKKAQKVLTVFAEKTQTAKPKSSARKAELIQRIEGYLHDFNFQFTMQEIVCNAIRGKLS